MHKTNGQTQKQVACKKGGGIPRGPEVLETRGDKLRRIKEMHGDCRLQAAEW